MDHPHVLILLMISTNSISQDTTIPPTPSCNATDSRGFTWSAEANTRQFQNCSLIDSNLSGLAEWFCVPYQSVALFNSSEPDRSKCESNSLAGASLNNTLEYTNSLNRPLTGGELARIVDIIIKAEVLEHDMDDLVNIINNLLKSNISWSEYPDTGNVNAEDIYSTTSKMFEKLLEKVKDLMYESENDVSINLENIVIAKIISGNGEIVFPDSESESRIIVLPESPTEELAYEGLVVRGDTLTVLYKAKHGESQTKLATELLFFRFVDDRTKIKSVSLNLKYLGENACDNCTVCAQLERVGSDDNMWDEAGQDGSCEAEENIKEVLTCDCDIKNLRKTLLFGGFQPVDFILPVIDVTSSTTTIASTTTTVEDNSSLSTGTTLPTMLSTSHITTDSHSTMDSTSRASTTTSTTPAPNSCTQPWSQDSSIDTLTFTFIGLSQVIILIVSLIQWFYNFKRFTSLLHV